MSAPPLLEAAKRGRAAELERLLSLGASVNEHDSESDSSTLFWACCSGSHEIVRLLIKAGGEVNAVNVHGHSPLHAASDRGYTKVVQDLLESGAAVNATNSEGLTPLHLAAYRGYSTIVDLLLRYGADLQIRSNDNKTALHEALAQKHFAVVEAMSYFDRRASARHEAQGCIKRHDPIANVCCRHQLHAVTTSPCCHIACQKAARPQPLPMQPIQLKKTVSSESPLPKREMQTNRGRSKIRAESLDDGVAVSLRSGQQSSSSTPYTSGLYPRQPTSPTAAIATATSGRCAATDVAISGQPNGAATSPPLSSVHLSSCISVCQPLGNGQCNERAGARLSATAGLDACSHHTDDHKASPPANGHGSTAVPKGDLCQPCSIYHDSFLPCDETLTKHKGEAGCASDDNAAVCSRIGDVSPADLAKLSSGHDRPGIVSERATACGDSIPRSLSLDADHSDRFQQQLLLQEQCTATLHRPESDGTIDSHVEGSRSGRSPIPRPRSHQVLASPSLGTHKWATGPQPLRAPLCVPHPAATTAESRTATGTEQQPASEENLRATADMPEAAMHSWIPGVHYTLLDSEPFSLVRQRGGGRRLLFRIASMLSVAYTLKVVLDADCDLFPLNLRLLSSSARVAMMSCGGDSASQSTTVPTHQHVARILASYCGDGSYFAQAIQRRSNIDAALPESPRQQQQHGSRAAAQDAARRQHRQPLLPLFHGLLQTRTAADTLLSMRGMHSSAERWPPASPIAAVFYVMPATYRHTLGSFMRWRRATWPVPPYGIEAGTYLRLAYEMLSAAVHLRQAANLCHCAVTPEAVYVTPDVRVAVGDVEACARLWAADGSCIAYTEESLVQSSCSRDVEYEWWPPELERHILLSCQGRPPEHPIYAHVLHEKSDSYSIGRTMYAIMAAQSHDAKQRDSPPIIFPVISRAKLHYRDEEVPDVTDGCIRDCYPRILRDLLRCLVRDVSSRPSAVDAFTRIEREFAQHLSAPSPL